MANDEWQMADEQCEVEAGGCDEGQSSEPIAEGSPGPVGGDDFQRVVEDSTNDKIEISSHEGTDAADGVCQGDGLEHGLVCGVKTPQKTPNEANLESTQSTFSQGVESENGGPWERERSQSAAGGARS